MSRRPALVEIELRTVRDGDCWIWVEGVRSGAPVMTVDSRSRSVHRYVYELVHDTVLLRREWIRRSCGEELCVNPDHLVLEVKSGYRHGRKAA